MTRLTREAGNPREARREVRGGAEALYRSLLIFNQATAGEENVEDRVFTSVATAMFHIERTLEDVKTFIPFRESMWEMVPIAGVEKQLPAAAKWRKKRRARAGFQTA